MTQSLIILGASGHSRVIADAARLSGRFLLIGLLDATLPRGSFVDGLKVLGNDDKLPSLVVAMPELSAIVGVGSNRLRERMVEACAARCPGMMFSAVVHPASTIAADVDIGPGAFVAAGTVINCGSRIGAHAVINTRASIDHDCVVEAFAFVAPGATLAGNVTVGRGAFVGTGAAVIQGIKIGPEATVGAGAAVIKPVPPGATVVGVPARPVRQRS